MRRSARKRWAVLISGRGSNLAALLDMRPQADIHLVVSSSAAAHGLLRARRAGAATCLTPLMASSNTAGSKKIDWAALDRLLRQTGITHIFLAGFMKVLPGSFVDAWAGRIVNLHPSLLPAYPGLRSIERAHADAADVGVTIHDVTAEVDAGTIICQRRSLKADEVRGYSLPAAEFLIHVDEQRAVRAVIEAVGR